MHSQFSSLCSRNAIAAVLVTTGFAASAPAFAQDDAAAEDNRIVVTAQRREERLQEVPLAITAASGEDLANQATPDLRGISQLAPSLNIAVYPNSSDTVSLTMRGQGVADAGQITKDGGVGLYVDGFYIARPQAALLDLGDPERIEVLRGPQGTLYGRNTTGGAVNIISSRPTGELGGDFTLSYGSRNSVRALANIDLPAMGAFAIKGTLLYTDRDGYVENAGAAHDYHEAGQLAGRVAVRWTPSPDFTADFAFDRGRVTSTMPYYVNPDFVGLGGPFAGYSADIDNTYTTLDIDASRSHFTDYQLTLNWDVADALTIRSLSSYRRTNSNQDINYGLAQSYPFVNPPYPFNGDLFVTQQHQYKGEQWSQEVQFIGDIGDLIQYTGGLYYFEEDNIHNQQQQIAASDFLRAPPTYDQQFVSTEQRVTSESISRAAYLQATISPPNLEELQLTVGGRYTSDTRRATRNSFYFGFQYEFDSMIDENFHNFSPSVNLAMQWTPDVMTYIRYSRGYKAGGVAEAAPIFNTVYGPEKVEAWEIGLKSQFLDRRVTFNASLFRNSFRDMQIDFGVDPVNLTAVATANAGRARVQGAEIELEVRPIDAIGLRFSYAYLDPTLIQVLAPANTAFDPLLNPASPVAVGDDVTSFFTLPFIPKNSLTVSGDIEFFNQNDRTLTLYASYTYQDGVYTSSVAGPGVFGREFWLSDPREVMNARLAYDMPLNDVDLRLSLFANNLLDHRSREFVIGVGSQVDTVNGTGGYFSQTAPWSEPRTIGVELRLSY